MMEKNGKVKIIWVVIVCALLLVTMFIINLLFTKRKMHGRIRYYGYYNCENFTNAYERNEVKCNTPFLCEDLCNCYFKLEKFNEAISVCKKEIEFEPERSHSYFILGKIYIKKGQKDLALQQYQKLRELAQGKDTPSLATEQANELLEQINQTFTISSIPK